MCVVIVLCHLLHVLMPINTTAIKLLNYGKDLPVLPFYRPVHLLVGMEPKDTTKPKMGRRKDLLFTASKENLLVVGSFSKQCLPEHLNWGSFKLRVQYVHDRAWVVDRDPALVD